jgi:O-antigen/teichoic acid export membrane protein
MAVDENSRIAKNSIALSLRMLFTMWLNLYATRVVLEQLGAADYGVYGVVGSVVSMFSILTAGLGKATQRFITFEIGKKDGRPQEMFSSLQTVTLLFAAVLFVVLEVLGLWFLQHHLNVPDESRSAAFWVFQFSVVSALISLISTPYNALIVAHEHLNVFAYITIVQVVLNFLVAISLIYIPGNHLFWYGFGVMLVTIGIRIIYQVFCYKHYPESKYSFQWNKPLLKEVGRFTGWATLDGGLNTIVWNGVVWIINLSFGPIVNAAYAIASQVNNAILSFAQNVQRAIDPQITKTYAAGLYDRHRRLVYMGSKAQAMLIYFLIIPFIVRAEYILTLWLGNVPEYAVSFCRLSVLMGLVISFCEAARTSITATGRIRRFVVIPNVTHLLLLPVCLLLNKIFDSPVLMMVAIVVMYVIIYALRLYLAAEGSVFSCKEMVRRSILPGVTVGLISFILVSIISAFIPNDFIGLILTVLLSALVILTCAWLFGLNRQERQFALNSLNLLRLKIKKMG